MPKWTRPFLPGKRIPQHYPGPFQELLPLQLKNRVSGKGQKTNMASCIMEMSIMFACMKANDFKEAPCHAEMAAFQKCYDEDLLARRTRKQTDLKGEVAPGSDKLTYKQVNRVLSKFPAFYPPPPK